MVKLRFGPSTKKARIRQSLSQSELGAKLDPPVAQTTISTWENETSVPSEDHKRQVRHVLGISSLNKHKDKPVPTEDDDELVDVPSVVGNWLNRARLTKKFSVPELSEKSGLSAVSIYNIESGKSQNPQKSTIEKLERALGQRLSDEAKEEAKEESTIEGVGEWFNFNPNSKEEWPDLAGIYVLYDISERPIYVGQGQKISSRLNDHEQKFWFKPPIVQNGAYVTINDKTLREKIEKVLIKFLKSNAVLNQQNVDR